MLFEHKWLYLSLLMKILATIFAFSLLTAVKLSAAPIAPDSVGKAFLAASDSLKATPSIQVSLSYTFGQQSSANGSLRATQYIEAPEMIVPAGITPELLARNDSLKSERQLQMRSDSSKAAEFAQKAGEYVNYDTISDKKRETGRRERSLSLIP